MVGSMGDLHVSLGHPALQSIEEDGVVNAKGRIYREMFQWPRNDRVQAAFVAPASFNLVS